MKKAISGVTFENRDGETLRITFEDDVYVFEVESGFSVEPKDWDQFCDDLKASFKE